MNYNLLTPTILLVFALLAILVVWTLLRRRAGGEELSHREKVGQERPEPATLRLTLVDTVSNRRLTVNLPDDVLMAQLVPALARKLGLPEGEYTLTVEGTGAPLAAEITLSGAGVSEVATLLLERASA